ncbi:hypothetical protein R3W88_025384 [Solanum pinnatisectum]|uniref:Uncharacterized protein n=1 Tax=Solanum pinnatisectum TaxID=50273 RepID=A0AAV9M384_9SOLN|nr:hypothetical protein R3W88_025384 [Solanum pinnatisectum]
MPHCTMHGHMDDGQEVIVKTWNFKFPTGSRGTCLDYPRNFHDEIVLLERSQQLKSACPFLVNKLIGFCFEKKMALVYDLKFKKTLCGTLGRVTLLLYIQVATDYTMLLKTLTVEKMDLLWSSPDIMIDEVSNASTISFSTMSYKLSVCRNITLNWLTLEWIVGKVMLPLSQIILIGFSIIYVFVLMELIMKNGVDYSHLGSYIREKKKGSIHKTLGVDAEITKLIASCVRMASAERPDIDYVISELKRIVGSQSLMFIINV